MMVGGRSFVPGGVFSHVLGRVVHLKFDWLLVLKREVQLGLFRGDKHKGAMIGSGDPCH